MGTDGSHGDGREGDGGPRSEPLHENGGGTRELDDTAEEDELRRQAKTLGQRPGAKLSDRSDRGSDSVGYGQEPAGDAQQPSLVEIAQACGPAVQLLSDPTTEPPQQYTLAA